MNTNIGMTGEFRCVVKNQTVVQRLTQVIKRT